MTELQNGMKTQKEEFENSLNSLLAGIERDLPTEQSIIACINTFEQYCGRIQNTTETYKTLIKKYPSYKEELNKWALERNNAVISSTTEYLEKKRTQNNNNFYFCNVFMQNNNDKKIPQPLKIPQGTLSYIGAMTHRGKTTALISITLDALMQGQKVYFITTEETPAQIFDRLIKAILYKYYGSNKNVFSFNTVKNKYELNGIDGDKLNDRIDNYLKTYENEKLLNDEPANLKECIYKSFELLNNFLCNKQFAILDHTQQRSFDELYNTLELLDHNSIIVLDYIQHVKKPLNAGSDNRQVIIQNESQLLSDIAGHNDFIMLAGGQFNRKGNTKDKDEDKYKPDFLDPTLFRESGDIEQDAHLIIGIGQELHKTTNAIGENVTRFYEILKQRGVKADTNQYKLIDSADFSLYSCDLQETPNGNKTLKFYNSLSQPANSNATTKPVTKKLSTF